MLTNDKGNTESNPYDYYAGGGDIASWGRVHKSISDSVSSVLSSEGELPSRGEAGAWVEASEKYSDLSNVGLGFEGMADFGADWFNSEGIIKDTIDSAREGKRLLGLLRRQAGIPGGSTTGGTDNPPPQPSRDVKAFVGGAVVLGLAYGVWRVSLGLKD